MSDDEERVPAKERRHRCWMAHRVAQAMSYDVPVRLVGADDATLAEGVVTHKTRDAQHGLVVRCGGATVPLPLIRDVVRAG